MSEQLFSIMEDTGAMGRYQILQIVTLFFSAILGAGHTLSFIFITSTPDITCPNYYNTSSFTEAAKAITNDSTQCGLTRAKKQLCANWTFDTSVMDETVVTKYDLLCDRAYMGPLSVTMFMCGFLIGSIFYGFLIDRFGRLKALASSSLHTMVSGFLSAFVPIIVVYLIARFLVGIGATGILLVIYSYLPECSVPRYRGQVAMMIISSWSISLLFLCFLTYFLRSVTYIDAVLSSLLIIPLIVSFIFKESPRWLFVEGHLERLKKALRWIARFNGRQLTLTNELFQENVKLNEADNGKKEVVESVHIKSFFIHPGMRRVSIVVWYVSLITSLVYYGISTGFSGLGGWNIYANMTISAVLEFLGLVFVCWLLTSRDRIPLLIIGYGGLASLLFTSSALVAYPEHSFALAIVCLIARALCANCFCLFVIYEIESYPTTHRTFAIGLAAAIQRVSAMIAPFVHYLEKLWKPLPFMVYGAAILIVSILFLLMPESRNKSQDTVAQAELVMKHSICADWLCRNSEEDRNESDFKFYI